MSSLDPLVRFKKGLEDLVDNDKFKINDLTFFARDYKDVEGVAQGIVEITVRHVHKISASLKLLGLYVVDSIVKNVAIPFRKLYTSTIVDAFVHSFQTIRDEEGRLKLYNLRATWKDIFPNSKMYELDIRVREHDPAWPLLSTPPEAKSAFRSLPNIPKIHVKAEVKDCIESVPNSETLAQKSTISASRDPRLNRKRKTSPETKAHIAEDFLIDRAGDHKMEAVARKQGKQEESHTQSKKIPLFGGQDLDMRSLPSPQCPARSTSWSTYINKHSEVSSRRETKDVDMRVIGDIVSSDNKSPHFTNAQPKGKLPVIPEPIHNRIVSHLTTPAGITESQQKLGISNLIEPSKCEVSTALSLSANSIISQAPTFFKAKTRDSPDPSYISEFSRDAMPMVQPYLNGPTARKIHGPPVQGPVWNVEIDGFPDMINIGVDPRMLSLVSHPKPPRRITIDGRQYSLLLDRVQPLVMIGDQVHAVRFRCDFATIVINDRCFTIPGTGFTKIFVGTRPYQAYLGGPGHELIIDGRPHTVPFGSQLTFINISYNSVGVKFVGTPPRNVNILPVIPPRLLRWAGQGLFGSPRQLHKPPLNPLSELARLAEGRQMTKFKPCTYDAQPLDTQGIPSETDEMKGSVNDDTNQQHGPVVTNTNLPSTSVPSSQSLIQPINVYELYQKLVKAGIVSGASVSCIEQTPPDLTSYSWERFKQPCLNELEEIYKGHQCGQCGSRFNSDTSPEFASHLDYHYMKNIADDSDRRSRNFYQSSRYWLLSEMTREGAPQFEPGTPVLDLQECKCPAFADPSKNVCAVCYEKFDVFWDHDEEEWMLRDAVLVQDRIYHPICQEDAGKEFTQTSPARSPVQPEEAPSLQTTAPPASSDPVDSDLVPGRIHSSSNDCPPGESEDDAFRCENQTECCIPGLSPDNLQQLSPIHEVGKIKTEETTSPPVSAIQKVEESEKPFGTRDPRPITVDTISADPLAALKAVLCGNVSSLLTPSSLP